VDATRKTLSRLSEDVRDGFGRVAAKGNFKNFQGKPPQFGGTGQDNPFGQGANPFQKGGGGAIGVPSGRRQIPKDHEFDKKAVKPIVKTLWAMAVALGHALTAHREFSRLKSSSFSPDGMLGGRGYVMPIKQIRQQLFESCEALSCLVDTLHDEINAPHWKPKIADLEKGDMAEIERLLSDAEEWVDNPEDEAEEEQGDIKNNSSWSKDRFKKDKHGPGSGLPEGGDKETLHKSGPPAGDMNHPDMQHQFKQSSSYSYDRMAAVPWGPNLCFNCGTPRIDVTFPCEGCEKGGARVVEPQGCAHCGSTKGYDKCGQLLCLVCRQPYYGDKRGNSSVDPGSLDGPRVDHLDRADVDQTGPEGSYNREDPPVADPWGESGGVSGEPMSDNEGDSYAYPSDWSGDTSAKFASREVYGPEAVLPGDQTWVPLDKRPDADTRYNDYERQGSSSVPDSATESTPTQGWDFGIGDGNGNDAHGQGAGGYGNSNPSSPDSNPGSGVGNRGVFGPQAELPNDPGGLTKDHENSDSNPKIEQGIGNNSVPHEAHTKAFGAAELPNDDDGPVARSDYYWGDKGNDFNFDKNRAAESEMPGNPPRQPSAPTEPRPSHLYEHEFSANSEVPGDENATFESAPGYGVDEYHRVEHGDQPYIKYDDNTHEMLPDHNYQRGDLPAPYVNDDLA
jgi:hypothetical protein